MPPPHSLRGVTEGFHSLTAKEKQTLRLLLEGYDAKSAARHLGLSVHTVNERLRDARRKLAVSSSREAARLLREAERATPENVTDKGFGDADAAGPAQVAPPIPTRRALSPGWITGGVALMLFALAFAAMSASAPIQTTPAETAAPVASLATREASAWLALVDAGDWKRSFDATAAHFRSHNTLDVWTKASVEGRVPMGRVLSREATTELEVPAPEGTGGMVVRFQTSFANKPKAVETLSLTREDGRWKVVGYWIE